MGAWGCACCRCWHAAEDDMNWKAYIHMTSYASRTLEAGAAWLVSSGRHSARPGNFGSSARALLSMDPAPPAMLRHLCLPEQPPLCWKGTGGSRHGQHHPVQEQTLQDHLRGSVKGDVPNMLLYENGNGKRGLNQFLMYALKSYTAMKLAVMMTRSNTESCNSDIS